MPDYSKSIIYKIQHIDKPELLFIGSTTDFKRIKSQHKNIYENEYNKEHKKNLYKKIRENDGFDKFEFIIIKEFPCNNKIELSIEAEKYRKELNATLNSVKLNTTIEEKKQQRRISGKKYAIKNGTWYTTSEEEKERQREIMRNFNKEKKLREENKTFKK